MANPEKKKKKSKADPAMSNEQVMLNSIMDMAKEDSPKMQEGFGTVIDNIMNKGMLPQHAVGIDDTDMEKLYAQAYQLYQTGKYDDARNVFASLLGINAMEPKYLFAHAACSHMLGEYDLAAKTYTHTSMLDADNPIPYYHSADCYIKLEDKISALVALKLVIKRSKDKPEYATIKDRAELTVEKLEKEDITEGLFEEESPELNPEEPSSPEEEPPSEDNES